MSEHQERMAEALANIEREIAIMEDAIAPKSYSVLDGTAYLIRIEKNDKVIGYLVRKGHGYGLGHVTKALRWGEKVARQGAFELTEMDESGFGWTYRAEHYRDAYRREVES